MQPSPVLLFTCFVSWCLFVYVFNRLTQPNICSFVYSIVWPSPLLILFKPRAQWNLLIINGFVQQTSLPKAGIKDLVSKLPLLFFQAKTIEITYCKLGQRPNSQWSPPYLEGHQYDKNSLGFRVSIWTKSFNSYHV